MTAVRFAAAAVLAMFGAIALVASPAESARADIAPDLTFDTTELTTPFGGDWLVEVHVTLPEGYGAVEPTWGTVDIQLDDVAGIYAAGLPIMRGGIVYFARPAAAPLLAAGEHHATAILRPSNTVLLETQTAVPLVITVTPLGLSPELDVLEVPGDEQSPYAVLTLSGEFVDTLGTPAGVWTVAVDRDGTDMLQTSVPVQAGAGPATLPLAEFVKPGTTLTVEAVFTPDAIVASGVVSTETSAQQIVTPALTPIEWLTRSIAVPWWMLAVSGALLIGAIVAAVIVVVRARRRPAEPAQNDGAAAEPEPLTTPAAVG